MFQDPEFLRQTDDYEALDRAARALSREVRDLEDEDRYNFKSKSYWTNHESWSIIIESTISGDLARPDPRNWSWPSRSPPSKMTMTQQRPSSGPNKQLIFRRWWQECKVGAVLGCFFFFFTRQLVLYSKRDGLKVISAGNFYQPSKTAPVVDWQRGTAPTESRIRSSRSGHCAKL